MSSFSRSPSDIPLIYGFPQSSQRHVLRDHPMEDGESRVEDGYSDRSYDQLFSPSALNGGSFNYPLTHARHHFPLNQPPRRLYGISAQNEYLQSIDPSNGAVPHQKSYTLQDALRDSSTASGPSSVGQANLSGLIPRVSDMGTAEHDAPRSSSILINSGESRSEVQRIDFKAFTAPVSGLYDGSGKIGAVRNKVAFSVSMDNIDGLDTTEIGSSARINDTGKVNRKKKPAKMHQCKICLKQFPRPSGLKTHMNAHNNYKPFSCTYPGCIRMFTVRSNAKRHLRTHGVIPSDDTLNAPTSIPTFEVNFNEPVVMEQEHKPGSVVPELKWMPPSLSSRSNAAWLNSIPEDSDSDWEDAKDDPIMEQSFRTLSIPLQPVSPSHAQNAGGEMTYEERNSYEDAGLYPYHDSQYRILPGPVAKDSDSNYYPASTLQKQ